MDVYLTRPLCNVKAEGIFNPEDRSIVIKAGATVSVSVSDNLHDKGGNKIIKLRSLYCEELITTRDIKFNSPSAAANFLTGTSSNGLIVWKDKETGKAIKEFLL